MIDVLLFRGMPPLQENAATSYDVQYKFDRVGGASYGDWIDITHTGHIYYV